MKPEIKEKITATNQKYLKKFLTEEAPAKLESQLEHMDWSYLDMIHNKEQQRGEFSPPAAMEMCIRDRLINWVSGMAMPG